MNNEEKEPVAVADSRELAERLVAQFEREDIEDSGCEYEYNILSTPSFFMKGIETVV